MNPKHILLLNTNEREVKLTTKAFKKHTSTINFTVLKDGIEGLKFLESNIESSKCKEVDLVLLDINLQNINGIEVLQKIKSSELLRKTVVIVYTASSSSKDIRDAYSNYCNGYIKLPKKTNNFNEVASKIIGFWLKTTVVNV